MNKNRLIIVGIIAVLIILAVILVGTNKNNNNNKIHYAYTLETNEISDCNSSATLLYQDESNNINYYTYCLSYVGIRGKVINSPLVDAFKQGVTIQDTMKYLKKSLVVKDGGTTIYNDDGTTGYTNNGITIIACNRISLDETSSTSINSDYYIGPKSMTMKNDFCQKKSHCTFTRTYNVINIISDNDEQYKNVTLTQFQSSEVTTVKILSSLLSNIIIGNNIEISFNNDYLVDNSSTINDVFKNSIVSIILTDKVGLDQINDVYCTN